MLQHPIIRYIALSLSLAFISVGALAQVSAVRPGIYNSRPEALIGPFSAPSCALTNAATILVNAASCAANSTGSGVNLNTITLAQNSVFAFPTGLPAGGNFQFGFRIDHGSGPFTATFATGYSFPSSSLTNGQPALSTGIDYVWCTSDSSNTVANCTASMLAMTPVGVGFSLLTNHRTANCDGVTTCAISRTAGAAGALGIVKLAWAGGNNSNFAQPTGITDGTNAFVATTGAYTGSTFYTAAMWAKGNLSGTSGTITATWASAISGLVMTYEEWTGAIAAPDALIGNATEVGATTSLTLATNGAVTQTGELVTSIFLTCCGAAPTAGNNTIDAVAAFGGNILSQYKLTTASSGTDSNSASWVGSQAVAASLGAFKH